MFLRVILLSLKKIINFTTHLYTLPRGNLVTLVKALLEQAASKAVGFDVMRLGKLSVADLQLDTGAVGCWTDY